MPEQSEHNEARIRDEHRKIDELLTRIEIIQLRKRFKISQSQATQIFFVTVVMIFQILRKLKQEKALKV